MACYSEVLRFLAIRVWIPVTGYYRGRVLRDETPQQTESVAPLPTISNPAAAFAHPVLISYEWPAKRASGKDEAFVVEQANAEPTRDPHRMHDF